VLPFLEKKKFILIIGDDGAILALVNKTKVEKRLFAVSPSLSDRREFNELLKKYPKVPIFVLLDTMEQSYTKQTLPAVGALAIGKLVKKRLDRDFAASDIKGAIALGRDEAGRRDWMYMFASAPVTPVIADWMAYVSSLDNKFTGIYMLPVEMESFVRSFNKKADPKDKKSVAPPWQFLVTHNKTGGFRQIILQNGKVIFTRLIRPGKDVVPDIVAGNIEQEILNTVDYMRRLSFGDEDELEVIAIVSAEIKRSMANIKIRGKEVNIYTPFDAANELGLKDVISPEDKFADLVLAVNFANSRAILKLEDPAMKMVNTLIAVNMLSTLAMIAIMPVFAIYILYLIFSIISGSQSVKEEENKKATIEKNWKDARQSDVYSIDDSNKIADVATLHKKLIVTSSPLDVVVKAAVSQRDYALTKSFTWSFDKEKKKENALFNMEFSNTGASPEELFKNYDTFRANVKKELDGYTVDVSELPQTITFEDKSKVIPVQIKIDSMDKEKK
jgi:hypothetical protein